MDEPLYIDNNDTRRKLSFYEKHKNGLHKCHQMFQLLFPIAILILFQIQISNLNNDTSKIREEIEIGHRSVQDQFDITIRVIQSMTNEVINNTISLSRYLSLFSDPSFQHYITVFQGLTDDINLFYNMSEWKNTINNQLSSFNKTISMIFTFQNNSIDQLTNLFSQSKNIDYLNKSVIQMAVVMKDQNMTLNEIILFNSNRDICFNTSLSCSITLTIPNTNTTLFIEKQGSYWIELVMIDTTFKDSTFKVVNVDSTTYNSDVSCSQSYGGYSFCGKSIYLDKGSIITIMATVNVPILLMYSSKI